MPAPTPAPSPSAPERPGGGERRRPLRRLVGRARHAVGRPLRVPVRDRSLRRTAVIGVVVALEVVAITVILALVGGAPHPVVHLYYIPIATAATQLDWRAAVAAAVPAGLFAGPLGTLVFGAATPVDSSWTVRAVMFVVVGLLVATLSGQAQRSLSSTIRDVAVSRRLRRALARGTVEAHYQPILDLGSGRVVGVEALCRWRDTDGTLVPPSEFIPLAERTGVILDLGRFMLRQTTAQCAQWSAEGLGHLVANVNVSAEQLSDRGFLGDVSAALLASGLLPEQLCLEITETTIIRNPEAALATVTAAHGLGVRIALDDFGTGHSSLRYLQDFPIDVIKIDQSFVAGVDVDPKCSTLVLGIIEMSHALGARCIAEGIEREAQRRSLQVLGCDEGQGYHLGRPEPPPQPGEGWLLAAGQGRLRGSERTHPGPAASTEPAPAPPTTPQPRKSSR